MSSTTSPDSSPHRIAMFASGYCAHHPLMIASSRVASSNPLGARRANGCLEFLSHRIPFVHEQEPSGDGNHKGKIDQPYFAYLIAVERRAFAGTSGCDIMQ